ncbi:hypothetical protein [Desulfosediminicola flagellatus]|uniref:hypothetical protein n=1 Tax=Desulfosediminicola flagellatus TaxID=2569541 RepID=UPI0010AC2883|nr:hypothetical protein [Desulfosediminicola flagellatus]
MKVYSSFSNILNFRRSRVDVETVYKRYALLYDQVIFNRYGCPIGKNDLFPTVSSYVAKTIGKKENHKKDIELGKNKKFSDIFVDMWEYFDNPEKIHREAFEYVSEDVSNKISEYSWYQNALDEEMRIHNHSKEYKAAAIVANDISSDIAFNLLLSKNITNFNMSLSPVVGEALKAPHDVNDEINLFTTNLVIPDFEALSWENILQLRQDENIVSFRKNVFNSLGTGNHPDNVLADKLEKDLWDLAEQSKPNIGKRIIEFCLSNLPLPSPINPFGYYYGAKAIANDVKQKDKAWVFVIQKMKNI